MEPQQQPYQQMKDPFLSGDEDQQDLMSQADPQMSIRSSTTNDIIEPFQLNYKEQPKIKYPFIFFACQVWIGAWFVSSFPAILKLQLQTELNVSQQQYQLFSILPSAVAIPLCFTGGILLDFIGIRKAIIIYSSIILAGAIIITIAASMGSLTIMLIGRVLTNAGAEVLAGSLNALFSYWFSLQGLTIVLALNLVCGRIGSILAGIILPIAYDSAENLYLPMLVGAIICSYSVICAVFVVILDGRAAKNSIKLGNSTNKKQPSLPKLSDFKKFSLMYWIILQYLAINYSFYFTIQNNLATILKTKFKLTKESIGIMVTMTNYLGFAGPFYAIFADKFPRTALSLLFSSILGFVATLMYLISPEADEASPGVPISAQILFGSMLMIFSIIIWPSITTVTQVDVLGTAFGNAYAFKNLYGCFIPLIIGNIIGDSLDEVNNTLIFFQIMVSLSIIINIIMWLYDIKLGNMLNKKNISAKLEKKIRRTTTYGMDIGG